MASRQETVDYILDQIASAGVVRAKKMFGEYGIYCDEKLVALVCDDQLFVKPTLAGKTFLGNCVEGSPYPGAKPWFLISGESWDDREWLSKLIRKSATEIVSGPKKAKNKVSKR